MSFPCTLQLLICSRNLLRPTLGYVSSQSNDHSAHSIKVHKIVGVSDFKPTKVLAIIRRPLRDTEETTYCEQEIHELSDFLVIDRAVETYGEWDRVRVTGGSEPAWSQEQGTMHIQLVIEP